MKLTPEQARGIPEKLKVMSEVELAKEYGVHVQTVRYWVKRHRANGVEIITKVGRRPIKL